MAEPFKIGIADLRTHLIQVEAILTAAVDAASLMKLTVDENSDPLVAGVVGAGCEPAMRNRGGLAQVAPLMELGGGLWAWLGYREQWDFRKGGRDPRLSFGSSSVTVHFGFRTRDPKPQMFRAEWAGLIKSGDSFTPQAENAGHPHWQFDAVESLVAPSAAEQAREFAAILREERNEAGTRDFIPAALGAQEVEQIVGSKQLSVVHFASVAPWWRPPGQNSHAHWPENVQQIRSWLSGTLQYVRDELQRL